MEGPQKNLSCKVKERAWLGQHHLNKSLEKKVGDHDKKVQNNKVHREDSEKISVENKKGCQSRVGMSLYLVKHLRPDNANAT